MQNPSELNGQEFPETVVPNTDSDSSTAITANSILIDNLAGIEPAPSTVPAADALAGEKYRIRVSIINTIRLYADAFVAPKGLMFAGSAVMEQVLAQEPIFDAFLKAAQEKGIARYAFHTVAIEKVRVQTQREKFLEEGHEVVTDTTRHLLEGRQYLAILNNATLVRVVVTNGQFVNKYTNATTPYQVNDIIGLLEDCAGVVPEFDEYYDTHAGEANDSALMSPKPRGPVRMINNADRLRATECRNALKRNRRNSKAARTARRNNR